MMRYALPVLSAALFTTAAYADPMPGMKMDDMDMGHMAMSAKPQDPLAGMTMDQQMMLCSKINALQRQHAVLTRTMKQQAAACQKMNMGASNLPAPSATLDR